MPPWMSITLPVTKALGGSQVTAQLDKLEEEYAGAKARYEKAVEDYRANIAKSKKETDEHLNAGEFGAALDSLAKLYGYTHPCGEESCDTYPCSGEECSSRYRSENNLRPVNRYEAYMEREGIDPEREFILEAVERAYALTEQLQQERRFDELDVALGKHAATMAGPPENAAKFQAKHKDLKQAWIDTLVADATNLEGDKPAAAGLLYGKCARLAKEKGDDAQAGEFSEKAETMRARAISTYRYGIAFGSNSGPHASEFVSFLKNKSFDGEVVVRTGDNASISIATASPSYRRSKGSTTSSFKYKSGTKQVTNPRWKEAQEECEYRQSKYESEAQGCAEQPLNSGGQPTKQCDFVPGYRDDAERACAEVSEYPQTVSQDVFDDYSYPVELLHLDASMAIEVRIDHNDGRRAVSFSGAKVRVTDQAHKAYTKNDGGVAADPANPPSESQGFSSLKSDIQGQLSSLVMKSFEQYRSSLVSKHSDGSEAEMDMLAVYVLLRPSSISDEQRARLIEVSNITDAVESLTQAP